MVETLPILKNINPSKDQKALLRQLIHLAMLFTYMTPLSGVIFVFLIIDEGFLGVLG